RRLAGRRPVHVVVGLAGTVAVGILVARAMSPPPAPPPGCVQGGAISEGGLAAMGQRISVSSGSDLRQHVGQDVMVCSVSVQSVPANEGFWLGRSEHERVWVQMITTGESALHVKAGDAVSFTGRVVPHGEDFPGR